MTQKHSIAERFVSAYNQRKVSQAQTVLFAALYLKDVFTTWQWAAAFARTTQIMADNSKGYLLALEKVEKVEKVEKSAGEGANSTKTVWQPKKLDTRFFLG